MGSEIKIIFYTLIGVVYLFYTWYKKEQRKQEERRINKKPVDHRNSEDIFRELQKSLRLPRYQPEEKTKPVRMTSNERAAHYKASKPETYKTTVKKTGVKMPEKTVIKEPHVTTVAESMEFDPRKAVIFSEILKRPQY